MKKFSLMDLGKSIKQLGILYTNYKREMEVTVEYWYIELYHETDNEFNIKEEPFNFLRTVHIHIEIEFTYEEIK